MQSVGPAHTQRDLWRTCGECVRVSAAQVTLSIVEIYCERIRCLLSDACSGAGQACAGGARDNLQVKTDPLRGTYAEGARSGAQSHGHLEPSTGRGSPGPVHARGTLSLVAQVPWRWRCAARRSWPSS